MKIVRFEYQDDTHYGLLDGDRCGFLSGDIFSSIKETGQTAALSAVKLLSPASPSKIICLGLNYRLHAEETNMPLPPEPLLFMKPSSSVVGPLDQIVRPEQSARVDYEAELALIVGRRARHVPEIEAMSFIFGFTAANDVTARDLQSRDGQWTRAKGFDTFCPLGPAIVTGLDPDNLKIETRLNGRTVQSSNTNDLIFKCAHIVSYVSGIMTLLPGDVILTGTPSGIGPMAAGDEVEVEIEGIGILKNFVR